MLKSLKIADYIIFYLKNMDLKSEIFAKFGYFL